VNKRESYYLLRTVTRAIGEFDLIADGDRVAVAVSGGKDSFALLELLLRHRCKAAYEYEIVAVHVDGSAAGLPDARPVLEPWLRRLGVEYHFVPLTFPQGEQLPPDCFRCAWNRRKALFTASQEIGCKKLGFGHNADDAAVTTMLNLMFQGRLETLSPRVEFFDGSIEVIRPLIYVSEQELDRYARSAGFAAPPECSQARLSQREQMKRFLRSFGHSRDQVRANLWRAARRHIDP